MERVAVIQSNYIPWKGYFDIIHDVDLFIFYDDVQFSKNSWRNRNKIKTAQGVKWLTIPVGSSEERLICEVKLDNQQWAKKHWTTIQQAYSKAPFFQKYRDFFETVYINTKWKYLSELNQYLITAISKEFLGINVEFMDSREFSLVGKKQERLLDLLQKTGAGLYVSGPLARDYLEEQKFDELGIKLIYKDYAGYPEYDQLFPPFEHSVSILDLLFNCGDTAPDFIWGWRNNK